MSKLNKITCITLNYQKDLDTTLVTISSDKNKVNVLELDNIELANLFHQVKETFEFQQGKKQQRSFDALSPKHSLLESGKNNNSSVTIPSSLYKKYQYLEVNYQKLKKENNILVSENKRLKHPKRTWKIWKEFKK